jgi:ATP-dependent RNA helicase DeaD
MLRMGFIEDVEWILGEAQNEFQTALFSATMPREIRRIAERYLKDPVNIEIQHKTLTVPTIEQHYFNVSDQGKADLLTRLLESEPSEATLVFVRTKTAAAELTERLQARGYAAEALHGDMSQAQRESALRRLRSKAIEIVVATDVAARGLDVEHITHVVNYDVPHDVESYVHRIGRTGRAGREGKAIIFVTARQQRMLHEIERYTGQRISPMKMPTRADIAARRTAIFKDSIRETLAEGDLELYLALVEELAEEGFEMAEVAAACARLARRDKPLEVEVEREPEQTFTVEDGMTRLFIGAGRRDGVRPGDIVGAIANEADVPGRAIGSIDIYDNFTFVELPAQFTAQVLDRMGRTMIRNRVVNVRVATGDAVREANEGRRPTGRPADRPTSRPAKAAAHGHKPSRGPADRPPKKSGFGPKSKPAGASTRKRG